MVYVKSIDADADCQACWGIRHFCLNTGERLTREDAYRRVKAGLTIRSGKETGPILEAATRGSTRYVRSQANDSSSDNLLQLPRTC